jgi:hypothetical protein
MRAPNIRTECVSATPAPSTRATRVRGGYLGRGLSVQERADLAARAYVQRRPIEWPSLATLATAYRAPLSAIRRQLNGNGKSKPNLAEALRTATPAERIEAARALGVDAVWDTMVLPLVSAAAE